MPPAGWHMPVWLDARSILRIRGNLLKSCTLAQAFSPGECTINSAQYVVFTLNGYRGVPLAHKAIRWMYSIFKLTCIFAALEVILAAALVLYILFTIWATEATQAGLVALPAESAKVVLSGVIILGLGAGVMLVLLKMFADFKNTWYEIDGKGVRRQVSSEAGQDLGDTPARPS